MNKIGAATDYLLYGLLLTFAVTAMFIFGQIAMKDINPAGTEFYDCQHTPLSFAMDISECTTSGNASLNSDVGSKLPTSDATVSPTTGNIFTDTFTIAFSWLRDKLGLGYVFDIISAPALFLTAIGLPSVVAYTLAALWYGVMLFLLVSWLLGR